MCDHCEGSSRRAFLGAVGVAGIAALSGCLAPPPTGVVEHLPGPILDEVPHGPIPSAINEKTIVVPPTPPQNQWIPTDTALGQILPRSAWTTASPDSRHMMPMNGVKLITIHHSGDGKPFLGESIHDIARHLEMVRQFHRQRGFNDIGYHFAVDRVGRVWQLRWLKYEGQHVRPGRSGQRWNEHNVGIVVLGDFNLQTLPDVQQKKVIAFARYVREKYALPATSVKLHGELVDTDCPGKRLHTALAAARKEKLV